jgi:MFS_1 like family
MACPDGVRAQLGPVVYAAISVLSSPVLPLTDSLGLRGLKARGLAYGPVRLWGSVAFIVANLAGGAVLGAWGAGVLVWALTAALVATAAAAWRLPRAVDDGGAGARPSIGSGLWRSATFVATVVGERGRPRAALQHLPNGGFTRTSRRRRPNPLRPIWAKS